MIVKVLYLFIIASYLKNADALICFNCGYLELVNGTKVPLTEEYGELPFCNDFASGNDNTVMAKIVRINTYIVHYTYTISLSSSLFCSFKLTSRKFLGWMLLRI